MYFTYRMGIGLLFLEIKPTNKSTRMAQNSVSKPQSIYIYVSLNFSRIQIAFQVIQNSLTRPTVRLRQGSLYKSPENTKQIQSKTQNLERWDPGNETLITEYCIYIYLWCYNNENITKASCRSNKCQKHGKDVRVCNKLNYHHCIKVCKSVW